MPKPAFDPAQPFETVEEKPPFDPSAPFEAGDAGQATMATETSKAEALGRGALQGATLGWGDEAAGAMTAGLQGLTNLLPQSAADRLGLAQTSAVDAYEFSRDIERERNDQAKAAHGGYYLGGELAGSLAVPLPGGAAAQGMKWTARLGRAALQGGAIGLAAGAGASREGDAVGIGKDALAGGAMGAAGGAIAETASPVVKWLAQKVRQTPELLERIGIDRARRAMLNGADSLSTRAKLPDEVVKQALESGAIKPFRNTEEIAARLGELTEKEGQEYSRIVSELEAAGFEGPHAKSLAMQLAKEGKAVGANSLGSPIPDLYRSQAQELMSKPTDGGRLGLTQAENIKRSLQQQAKYGRFEDTPLNEAKRDIASRVRQAVENTIETQAKGEWTAKSGKLPQDVLDTAAQFVPTKQRLGKLLEAEAATTRGLARASQRGNPYLPGALETAAAAATGSGLPIAAKAGLGFLRARGTSATAAAAYGTSKALTKVGELARLARVDPTALTEMVGERAARAIASAAAQGEDRLAVTHYMLSQTDPEYRQRMVAAH